MHQKSIRGAALVKLVWVVVFALLFVVGGIVAFVQMNEVAAVRLSLNDAQKAAGQAKESMDKTRKEMVSLAKLVGFNDPGKPESAPSEGAIKQAMETVHNQVSEVGSEVDTLQKALDRLANLYKQRVSDVGEKENQRKRASAEADEARATTAKVSKEKQDQIDDLRKQLADSSDRSSAERAALEQRITGLQNENRDLDGKYRDYQAQAEKKESDQRKEITLLKSRVSEFQRKMAFAKEPMRADGQVLSVSDKLDLGYIDLGNKNRLRRGMRFEVLSPDVTMTDRKKGVVEVVEVHPEYSEVRVVSLKDEFVPLAIGDLVANPIYDPTGERKAVLMGRFTGRLSKSQLSTLLTELNIKVQGEVDITTDYLILGSEDLKDGEPIPYSQNPEFKRAENLGVVIVPFREIEGFFAY